MPVLSKVLDGLPRLPTKEERAANKPRPPWELCRELSGEHYLYFAVGFLAWVVDAFDFFSVSVTLTRLSAQFNGRPISDITQSITLTLLFRSAGALGFGVLTDRFGRRWPMTANLLLIAILALATGFVQTFQQFLAVRSLFGIMMGGIYGMAAATALENMAAEARGLFSGLLQQGYAVGYLLAAILNLTLVSKLESWRSIFYFGSGLSLSIAILRAFCPESPAFLQARERAQAQAQLQNRNPSAPSAGKVYLKSLKDAIKQHWGRFIFAILLMTGFNFLSHGSQDLYPTYIQVTKGMTSQKASLLTIIGNCGAIVGGLLGGWLSQFLGRRLAIIAMCIWAAAFIPLWILPNSFPGLALGVFFLQFGVQGAWGVVPIYLSEIAPPACLAIFTGLTYQIGNMISASCPEIEAAASRLHQVWIRGAWADDYSTVQGVLIGCAASYIIIMTCFGKEFRGRDLVTAIDETQEDQTNIERVLESTLFKDEEKAQFELAKKS